VSAGTSDDGAVSFADAGVLVQAPSAVVHEEGIRPGGPGQTPSRPTAHLGRAR
jgi:hypothetical protein